MMTTTANAFLDWHCTATKYQEFLNQRIHSALAYQISHLNEESMRHLPSAGLITCIPQMLADGAVEAPALKLWVQGVHDDGLDEVRAAWDVCEVRPFSSINQFLNFEQVYLDLESDRDKSWDTLDHEERIITAISFVGLIKPLDWICRRASSRQSLLFLLSCH